MSESLEVVLFVRDVLHGTRPAGNRLPKGVVRAIEVAGKRAASYELGKGTVEVGLRLPPANALHIFGSFALHHAHNGPSEAATHASWCLHNCLVFMAESQNWPVGRAEQFNEFGPRLTEGGYTPVTSVVDLTPGAPYALPDDHNRLIHGMVGTDLPNRCLEFDGSVVTGGGQMRLAETSTMVELRTERFVRGHYVVQLHGQSYQSSETQ